MKVTSNNSTKSINYKKEQIKENCIIEFLCLLTDKPVISIKSIIKKLIQFFNN